MATKTIAWESGGGYITLTYTGVGNAPISVRSDANESFADRQQIVRVVTTSGSPSRAVDILVKQKGKAYPAGTVFNFSYTGTVQEVTLPPGKYKLQCWGAQGGDSSSYSGVGSKGGYSEGVLTLTETTTLYIFVGGKGASSGNGGWNCGGGSTGSSSYDSGDTYGKSYPACGGGATDIATVTSDMSYSSKRNNRSSASLLSRCIVAGGGAGASARYTEEETTNVEYIHVSTQCGTLGTTVGSEKFRTPPYIRSVSEQVQLHAGITYTITCNSDYEFWSATTTNGVISGWYQSYTITPSEDCIIQFSLALKGNNRNTNFTPGSENLTISYIESTSTSTFSSKSNSSQQGGGTSGRGTSPGTQTSGGGEFGKGKNQETTNYRYASGAGGGGWYGGGSSQSDSSTGQINSSGGGSGFVNTAANASSRPSGYTGLQLDSGNTKDGATSFPSPSGGNETGHSGNGYARITVADENGNVPDTPVTSSYNWAVQSGTWNESSNSDAVDGIMVTCQSPGDNGSTVIRCTFRGLSSITFRCRYQGESSYDYLTVGNLDSSCTRSSYKTSLKGSSGTWKDLTYSISDKGEHYVEFCYSKDGSVDTSPDNADVLIYNVTE